MPFLKGIGGPELIIILVVVLILFGPKQLPKLGKMFGKTMKEVRTGMDSFSEEMNSEKDKVEETNPETVVVDNTPKVSDTDGDAS